MTGTGRGNFRATLIRPKRWRHPSLSYSTLHRSREWQLLAHCRCVMVVLEASMSHSSSVLRAVMFSSHTELEVH